MVDVDDLAKITQDGAKPPWENNAEFLGDMTLRLSDGTEFSVNKHVMCVFSSVIRAAPSLDEPFPIPHPSRDAVETLLCLCYERVMLPKDYKFEYGIFKTVANVWDLATFLNCSRILHDLRKEIDRAIHDLSRKDYAVRQDLCEGGDPRYEALQIKAEYDLAFTALHAMEAVPSGSSIKWNKFELTVFYRCVNFGCDLNPPGGIKAEQLPQSQAAIDLIGKRPFSYSKDHAKRLSASTKDQLLERMSGFCPTDPWQTTYTWMQADLNVALGTHHAWRFINVEGEWILKMDLKYSKYSFPPRLEKCFGWKVSNAKIRSKCGIFPLPAWAAPRFPDYRRRPRLGWTLRIASLLSGGEASMLRGETP